MGLDKIWVFGEANGDAVATITLEMLAKAREIADTVEVFMGADGDEYAEELGDHGAETVYCTGELDGAAMWMPQPLSWWAPPKMAVMLPPGCR